jgi:hypothetical protein
MKENELKALMRAQLIAGLVSAGYPSVKVKQSYQSTTQGREQLPTLYYWQLSGPTGFGRPWHVEQYNILTDNVDVTEVQNILTTFQIMATAPVSPTDTSAPTPGDLALAAMQVIRSSVFIASLQAQGAGLCDNTAIRPMQIQNDQDQFEDVPSFDFTVAHQSRIILTGPALEGAELNILRV